MENNLITKDNEVVKTFFLSLEQMLDNIESRIENCKPTLNASDFFLIRKFRND